MRIYHDTTLSYIRSLAVSISKDPLSLHAWKCLHIHPPEADPVDVHALEILKETRHDSDCDVVICPDGDILIVSRHLDATGMYTLGAAMCASLDGPPEAAFYDVFTDWQAVRAILLGKTKQQSLPAAPALQPGNGAQFGETDSLRDVFGFARTLRAARHPQHVMVVEDDPITRRIVIGALKQNFAMISAQDAQEAVANYLMHAPDIVFLDIGLPDASGFDVLKHIIANDPQAYVVMFSSHDDLESITTSFAHGASGFVAKPFKQETLRHYIMGSVEHHQKAYV